VSGVGIDELYKRTDPFDVRAPLSFFDSISIPSSLADAFVYLNSTQNAKTCLSVGLCGSIR